MEKTLTVAAGEQSRWISRSNWLEHGHRLVEISIDPFNVVPDQATNSLFGLDKPLEEIPRSISVADSELLTRYNVKTVNDIVTVASGRSPAVISEFLAASSFAATSATTSSEDSGALKIVETIRLRWQRRITSKS